MKKTSLAGEQNDKVHSVVRNHTRWNLTRVPGQTANRPVVKVKNMGYVLGHDADFITEKEIRKIYSLPALKKRIYSVCFL